MRLDRDHFENNYQLPPHLLSLFDVDLGVQLFRLLKVRAENKSLCINSNVVFHLPTQA